MRYWWVNHKQTGKREVEGGYIWSPKVERSGARSQFYDNMTRARSGDVIFSYIAGQIGYVGTVTSEAAEALKPAEFGVSGDAWAGIGWKVDVEWRALDRPFRPKEHLDTILPLLPKKYSPINLISGDGNQKAYLSEISKSVADVILMASISDDVMDIGQLSEQLADADYKAELAVLRDIELSETVKEQVVKARRGQGEFRKAVMAREKACRVTGLSNPDLLIASHIKPWRECTTAAERLSGANGLMLSPNADRLFDQHLITFNDDGTICISPALSREDCNKLGLPEPQETKRGWSESSAVWGTEPLAEDQIIYMRHHRQKFFGKIGRTG